MTINTTDIKLLESERMTDASDGGGRRTSRVIVDGAPSNIFPKVSRLDSVYGRVNMRKAFGAVVTANLDTYAGAHAVIMDPPNNGQIHVNLFTTGSDYDTRAAARDRIESYVISGPESRMVLYGRQLVGQQALLVYQRPEEPLPEIGEVYCLSKEVNKVVVYQQFVRVTELTHEVRTFEDINGPFERRIISLKLSAPLRYQFDGHDAPQRIADTVRESLFRTTTVADAARYYGIQKLVETAPQNALTLRVESVYSPIVPTTQRETPIALASIAGAGQTAIIGPELTQSVMVESAGNRYTPRSIKPKTLYFIYYGQRDVEDDGAGNIVNVIGGAKRGEVNYETGQLTFFDYTFGVNATMHYTPAISIADPARTRAIEITMSTRGTVYSEVLDPLPGPGSTIVDYRALGKWYRLRDDGTGQLTGGDASYGAGTVDYVTGALVVTLGALPDVESSVLISWGSPVDYEIRAGATADNDTAFAQTFTLANTPIHPATLSISFISDASPPYDQAYTATDAAGTGVIAGNGVDGFVNYTTGEVRLRFTTHIPNAKSILTVNYQKAELPGGASPTVTGGINIPANATLPQTPVAPSSFVIVAQLAFLINTAPVQITDDGAGKLWVRKGQYMGLNEYSVRCTIWQDTEVGTINYSTGAVVVNDAQIPVSSITWFDTMQWGPVTYNGVMTAGQAAYTYRIAGAAAEQLQRTDQISLADSPLTLDLTKTSAASVVPGSVLFTVAGKTFLDRNGTIYTDFSDLNGSATPCGSIEYTTGRVTLSSGYSHGVAQNSIAVSACLTRIGDFSATGASFRTAGSPLRPASFYTQATSLTGELLSGTSDASGNITGPKLRGSIVQEMGVASVEFGEMLIPEGGTTPVWTPIEIAPNTLRYSAVVLSNLPINADILGLDPVRLPSDGRVPIFRPADVVVIHNTKTTQLPNPVTPGGEYYAPRGNLSDFWITDAENKRLPPEKFVIYLASGQLTMAADLDLTGYTQPLTMHHRIEEMQLLSDVQINGVLSLTTVLGREFDADSYVSSALLFGDLNARYTNLFDQASWTSEWSDTLIGGSAAAQYNDIDFPIEVLNEGAVTDRWRINFTTGNPSAGTASFQVISENLGVIAAGNTGTDCAPVNALTGKPYFVIRAGGWGIGWSVGNQVRFNTAAAAAPIWIARTVLPGATLQGDSFDLQLRGDVDA